MCGICGYVNWDNTEALNRMLSQMVHRGPDEEGKHFEPGLALGVRRLSIIDPECGHQPAFNETRSVCVVFNGEIYNYRELREELIQKGHCFTSRCDTEVIVHLYEEAGEEMVHRLRGMFAIALWDSRSKTLFLIRDRLGIKPLYFFEKNHTLIFASELNVLRAAIPDLSLRTRAIAEYLSLLYIPLPETIYEDVRGVLPGEMLKIQGTKPQFLKYFDLPKVAAEQVGKASPDMEERFRETLKDAVRSHLVSDVPLGLFLSGGLDSGSILAMMRAVTDGPIRTFSIGYENKADHRFNETSAARLIAERFGAEHTEELLTPDIVSILPEIVKCIGEPFADASAIPTYLVSKVAKKSVTVALSGIGGDELFGGYPRHLGALFDARYRKLSTGLRKILADVIAPMLPEKGGHTDNIGRLRRFLQSGLLPLDQRYIRWITFIPFEWGNRAFSSGFREQASTVMNKEAFTAIFNSWPSPNPADKAMGFDLQTYLPGDLLRMADRLSMAHSLEVRVPFCDHFVLLLALQIEAGLRLRKGRLKGFMRDALEPVLPQETLGGPKRGFMVPIARWLREDLREMITDLLSEQSIRQRGYLEPAYVSWLIYEHLSGRRNFSDQLFALLMLELWLRQFKDKTPEHEHHNVS